MNSEHLNDAYPDWATGDGIFASLQSHDVPWAGENIAFALDWDYHGNISGSKLTSPLLDSIRAGDALTDTEKERIAIVIVALNNARWARLWETMLLEYNPIENYSMTEAMTNDQTVTDYGKSTTRTDNLTRERSGQETTTPNLQSNTTDTIHGFNSTAGVPSESQSATSTGSTTREYADSDGDTGTQTLEDAGSDTSTRNYTLTRSGNIGVTTSQQMIESERALWKWSFFRDVVYPDIDKVLTLSIY